MDVFDRALEKVLVFEGGWVDDVRDPGGETYCGISRRANPSWVGWATLDGLRKRGHKPQGQVFPGLSSLVAQRYRLRYWETFRGDDVALVSDDLAVEMFNHAVHCGVGRAVEFLQRGLNVLNDRGRLWPDIAVDGAMGVRTMHALQASLTQKRAGNLVVLVRALYGAFLVGLVEKNPTLEAYHGWWKRV
jgi:lysozyme family protein